MAATIDDPTVDLNADLGEGFGQWTMGDDEALLDIVTSANVACGFHAGDPCIMRRICQSAADKGVTIGAHVSYNDLVGFGRRRMDVPTLTLIDDIIYQIAALDGFARVAGTNVAYVKPHGALSNAAAVDERQAVAIVTAAQLYNPELIVLAPASTELERRSRGAGMPTETEAFPDRAYHRDATLVARSKEGAVLHDAELVAERAVRMARHHEVVDFDGTVIDIRARSLCIHGDTPGAVQSARTTRHALIDAGIRLAPFA